MSQWFPGHMARAQREVRENIRLVDLVLEVVDARAPAATRAGGIQRVVGQRPRLVVLAKSDLADRRATEQWLAHLRAAGETAVAVDAVQGAGVDALIAAIEAEFAGERARLARRQRLQRPARVMVLGIPNVGKSSLINRLAGRRRAATGARPGITRGKQWVRGSGRFELLDLPGILPPRLGDGRLTFLLAVIGSLPTGEYDLYAVAAALLTELHRQAPDVLRERWRVAATSGDAAADLEAAARGRGMLRAGGRLDLERAATVLLQEFRAGKLGRFTLQRPDDAPVADAPNPSLDESSEIESDHFE